MTEDEAWDELERKQAKKWNASDMAYRPNGLTIDANIINKAKWYQEGYEAGQKDEREACAKLCEEENWSYAMGNIIRSERGVA